MPDPTRRRTLLVADLFCGAGGSSSGARRALASQGYDMKLVAVNHWDTAIETHSRNHPEAAHYCVDIATAKPRECVPGGKLDLLMASPTCTYHSRARGGRPTNDQQRMDPWHVVAWLTEIRTKRILIENVPEFQAWGPVNVRTGRPIRSRRGEYFLAWIRALEAIGYVVDWRVLNAADYGDATTRERFFLIGACDGKPLRWPEPTHSRDGGASTAAGMFPQALPRWRAAREIIDWSIPGRSIFDRKKALAPNTLKRIARGLEKFGGPLAEPFLVILRNNMHSRSIDAPVPTISAGGGHVGIAQMNLEPMVGANRTNNVPHPAGEPVPSIVTSGNLFLVEPTLEQFTLGQQSGSVARSVEDPLPTIATGGAIALVESELTPFVLSTRHTEGGGPAPRSADDPLPTIVATDSRFHIVEPFIAEYYGNGGAQSTDDPLNTVTTRDRFGLVEPYIVSVNHGDGNGTCDRRAHDINRPLKAVTGSPEFAVVEPFIVPQFSDGAPRSTDDPVGAITTTSRGIAVVQPFITPQFGEREGQTPRTHSLEDPLPSVTSHGAGALVEPVVTPAEAFIAGGRLVRINGVVYRLDIRFRMLKPRELARAMGFSDDETEYEFVGTGEQIVKQIGNAVPVNTAAALVAALVGERS